MNKLLILLIGGMLLMSSLVMADSISLDEDDVTDDSFWSQAYTTTNYGSLTYIDIAPPTATFGSVCSPGDGRDNELRGGVIFDISAIPSGATITSANFTLYMAGEGIDYSGEYFNVSTFRINESWDESTVTWNNQPSMESTRTDSIKFVYNSAKTNYVWDVTSIVSDDYDDSLEEARIGIKGTDGTTLTACDDNVGFGSTGWAGTATPFLDISYTVDSEPEYNYSVSSCRSLTQPGVHTLTNDITNAETHYCINITSDNVTLNCNGYTIDGVPTTNAGALQVYRSTQHDVNVTVNNCVFTDWKYSTIYGYKADGLNISDVNISTPGTQYYSYGINLDRSDDSVIHDVVVDVGYSCILAQNSDYLNVSRVSTNNCSFDGIELNTVNYAIVKDSVFYDSAYGVGFDYTYNSILHNSLIYNNLYGMHVWGDSHDNTIHYNVFRDNSVYGIKLQDTGDADFKDNHVYNNLFNNSENVVFTVLLQGRNLWNTTPSVGTRIYSDGTNIGGNYYTNSSNTGFSDTCSDSDTDGFCDDDYDLEDLDADCSGSDNCDYSPYSNLYSLGGPTNSCSCPTGENWALNIDDNCNTTVACDITGYNISLSGSSVDNDRWYVNAIVTFDNLIGTTGNRYIKGGSSGYLKGGIN